jgi:transmembrane sensor
MSSETMNWETIARYLAGESQAEEQAAVRQWLAAHPADAQMIGALDDVLGPLTPGPESLAAIDVEAALAKSKARRATEPASSRPADQTRVLPFGRRSVNWIPIAAAAGIVLVAGIWWSRPSSQPTTPVTTIASRTLTTPVGGRDSLVLPDGSQVMLGPGSSLVMAQGYGQTERRISLTGEAFFTVAHDAAKPFVVVANGAELRDVGTAFVVHSDGGGVRVAVTEGVVELTVGRQAATRLNAGDAASISPAGAVVAQRGVGARDDLAWTTGRLVFRDAPLTEVAEDLQRWYGVHLDIRDASLSRRPLSATFDGDSLGSVLQVISGALGATFERRGDTIVMRSVR